MPRLDLTSNSYLAARKVDAIGGEPEDLTLPEPEPCSEPDHELGSRRQLVANGKATFAWPGRDLVMAAQAVVPRHGLARMGESCTAALNTVDKFAKLICRLRRREIGRVWSQLWMVGGWTSFGSCTPRPGERVQPKSKLDRQVRASLEGLGDEPLPGVCLEQDLARLGSMYSPLHQAGWHRGSKAVGVDLPLEALVALFAVWAASTHPILIEGLGRSSPGARVAQCAPW